MFNRTKKILVCSVSSLSFIASSHAAVVLTIDVSTPGAVTFTATSEFSSTDSSLSIAYDGFTVDDFFTSSQDYDNSSTLTGNLSPVVGSGLTYNGFGTFEFSDNDGAFKNATDLSIFSNGTGAAADTQVFQTTSTAFTGVATFDFSASLAALPVIGTSGNVYSGYWQSGTADHGELVGQWQVVPEPSSTLLLGLGAFAMISKRRRTV